VDAAQAVEQANKGLADRLAIHRTGKTTLGSVAGLGFVLALKTIVRLAGPYPGRYVPLLQDRCVRDRTLLKWEGWEPSGVHDDNNKDQVTSGCHDSSQLFLHRFR
jgi:hypothetical protein